MKISIPEKLFFFTGASAWIPKAIEYATQRGIECHVFAVSRHLEELFDNTTETFADVLTRKNISFFHCDDINTSTDLRLKANGNCIAIGLGEAYTFTTETLALFNRQVFDFMTIRMPKYRGGAHYTWQILQRNRIGAWYVQLVNEDMIPGGYDTGEIVMTHEYIIPASARVPADYFKLADIEGLKVFTSFIDGIIMQSDFPLTRLQENFSMYLPRLYTLRHGYINWNWSGDEIERFACAFDDPYAGSSTFCNGQRFFLKGCQFERGEGGFHPFMNGLIYRMHNSKVFVAVSDGTIIADRVVDEQGVDQLQMVKTGYRFYTPLKYLEEAMMFNAEYTSKGLKS